jgi:acyl-CoA reductase-like NAD-dependent aldehyde dehydrogenase
MFMEPRGPIIGMERLDWGTPRTIRSPFDQRVVSEVRFGDRRALDAAIALAELTYTAFRREPAHRRAAWLRAMAAGIRRRGEELSQAISQEAGKPIRLARLEVEQAADTCTVAAEEAGRVAGDLVPLDRTPDGEGRVGLVRRFPIGPIAAITAFNFPLHLAAHRIAAAVAAGSTIVLKPASQAPSPAVLLGLIALEAGLPEGVLSVVPCDASDAAPLIEDDRLRMLCFTGSSEVGWLLKARAGRKKVVLELGGNAAAIVEPDVDVDVAARRLAMSAFTFAGQLSTSVQRIYVHERVTRRLLDTLIQTASLQIPTGDPAREDVLCGPVVDTASAGRIQEWVDQAVAAEAALLLEPRRDGNVLTPAVLTQVKEDLPLATREVFGPVVVVETYRGINRAIELAAKTQYGLQTAIFSNDIRKVMRAFEEIQTGTLIHNDYPSFRVDALPYGGVKASGMGRSGPRHAIEEMTEGRVLVVDTRI